MDRSERRALLETALSEARPSTNGWLRANCPFCVLASGREDKRTSLGFQSQSGFYRCYRCGAAGRLRVSGLPVAGTGLTGLERAEDGPKDAPTEIEPPEGFLPLGLGYARSAVVTEGPRRYLESRGFDEAIWRAVGLGVCFEGRAKQRIVIPILEPGHVRKPWEGPWLGWAARDYLGTQVPKYLYPEGMQRGSLLYQHEALFVETDKPVLCVEGAFDALPYLGDAVAFLGKPSRWQRQALKYAKRPIVVCLDGDAHEEGEALAMHLRLEGLIASYVRLPPKADPNTMALREGPEWLHEQARRSLT